jgi:hypothetical protein
MMKQNPSLGSTLNKKLRILEDLRAKLWQAYVEG